MSYTHLTATKCVKIETYLEFGMFIRSVAIWNPGYESGRAQRCAGTSTSVSLSRNIRQRSGITRHSGTGSSTPSFSDEGNRRRASRRSLSERKEPVLSHHADHRPRQGVQRARTHSEVARPATLFRRPVRVLAKGEHQERQRSPRKCLNWKTAQDVFTEEMLRLI